MKESGVVLARSSRGSRGSIGELGDGKGGRGEETVDEMADPGESVDSSGARDKEEGDGCWLLRRIIFWRGVRDRGVSDASEPSASEPIKSAIRRLEGVWIGENNGVEPRPRIKSLLLWEQCCRASSARSESKGQEVMPQRRRSSRCSLETVIAWLTSSRHQLPSAALNTST